MAVAGHIASWVEIDPEPVDELVLLGAGETHGQEHELCREVLLGSFDGFEPHAVLVEDLLNLDGLEAGELAVLARELDGVDREDPLAAFLVRRRRAVHQRPRGPRRGGGPLVGRPRHDLELMDRLRTLAVGRAEAVGAGVATTDDDDVLALSGERGFIEVALLHLVGGRQELHGLVDAFELAPWNRQVSPLRGAACQHHFSILNSGMP